MLLVVHILITQFYYPLKFEVGAIHELPLPQTLEITAKKIISGFSNANGLAYDIDSLNPKAILL